MFSSDSHAQLLNSTVVVQPHTLPFSQIPCQFAMYQILQENDWCKYRHQDKWEKLQLTANYTCTHLQPDDAAWKKWIHITADCCPFINIPLLKSSPGPSSSPNQPLSPWSPQGSSSPLPRRFSIWLSCCWHWAEAFTPCPLLPTSPCARPQTRHSTASRLLASGPWRPSQSSIQCTVPLHSGQTLSVSAEWKRLFGMKTNVEMFLLLTSVWNRKGD